MQQWQPTPIPLVENRSTLRRDVPVLPLMAVSTRVVAYVEAAEASMAVLAARGEAAFRKTEVAVALFPVADVVEV